MDFPVSFTEKMKAILGDEFEDFLKGYDSTRHYARSLTLENDITDFV